jgi:phosphatidylserine/phosphatidylglycerophosphate/cardiolipin synthase-like enzyme
LKREILALIASARETLDVTTWAVDSDNEVFAQLKSAAKRVHVRLLAHEEPANRRALEELAQAGAEIRFCPRMHAKVWLADRDAAPSALVASANMLADGLEEGYELGVRLEPGDARLASVTSFVVGREAAARRWVPSAAPAEKVVRSLQQLDKVVRVAPRLKLF